MLNLDTTSYRYKMQSSCKEGIMHVVDRTAVDVSNIMSTSDFKEGCASKSELIITFGFYFVFLYWVF